jgi:hypothetical protein
MNSLPKMFADFNNADEKGRVRLNTTGSMESIQKTNLQLVPGLKILLDDEEGLSTVGDLEFSEDEKIWVAKIDWNALNADKTKK